MVTGRRSLLAGLLMGLLPLAAGAADPLLVPVQYGYGRPPRRRRRRCWTERQRIVVQDRFGRPRRQWVTRQVCR